jgi:hypothetical protein
MDTRRDGIRRSVNAPSRNDLKRSGNPLKSKAVTASLVLLMLSISLVAAVQLNQPEPMFITVYGTGTPDIYGNMIAGVYFNQYHFSSWTGVQSTNAVTYNNVTGITYSVYPCGPGGTDGYISMQVYVLLSTSLAGSVSDALLRGKVSVMIENDTDTILSWVCPNDVVDTGSYTSPAVDGYTHFNPNTPVVFAYGGANYWMWDELHIYFNGNLMTPKHPSTGEHLYVYFKYEAYY